MLNLLRLATLGSALALSAAASTVIDYHLSSSTTTITFSLPEKPTIAASCMYFEHCFSVTPVSIDVNGTVITDANISFYLSDVNGGLTITEGPRGPNQKLLVNADGANHTQQLFTGSLTDPTLLSFDSTTLINQPIFGTPVYSTNFQANIMATPEPATFGLATLAAGFAFAGLRRRRQKA